ncbi:Transposase and inactivated derivatives [Jiangella alba]|uniref:Transposase and inactivated derivatives n=1 Tax=Jiangella alba TaxID=561176 RepID=A0A1H5MXC2_9ACTN|nr:Transposase and inactivated derivatives [Jiangella alba]
MPKEFREDVIRVYRGSDASMAQVAKDFGISASCLKRWLTIDERKSSANSGSSHPVEESDALREANKRIKLLEQENEVLRRAAAHLSQAHLPGK